MFFVKRASGSFRPFGTGFVKRGASAGTPASTRWRLLAGSPGANLNAIAIREIDMFADDTLASDLCSGGTASASSVNGSNSAANAFDENSGTYWQTNTGADDAAWIEYQFATAQSPVAYRVIGHLADAGYLPNTISLQYHDGSSWVTVRTTTFAQYITDSYVRGWVYSDGAMGTVYRGDSATTLSSSAYACKGTILDVDRACQVEKVECYISPSGTETYRIVLALVNTATDQISSILESTATQSISTTGTHTFTFASPHSLTVGQRIAALLVRTDGTATSPCRIAFPSVAGEAGAVLDYYGSVRYATTSPTAGDSILFATNSVARTDVQVRFTP